MLIGEWLIWLTRAAWGNGGHHFEFGLVLIVVFVSYLYLVMGIFAVELFVILPRIGHVPKAELAVRTFAFALAVLPAAIARIQQG